MTLARQSQERAESHQASAEPVAVAGATRLWEVDALRGVAIILMVFYHFMYDLDQFGDFAIGANRGNWQLFANFIAFMFVFLVGVSLVLSYSRVTTSPQTEWMLFRKYLLRGLRILGYGVLITVVVWLVAPQGEILFGILHLIGLSIIFAYPFLRWPVLAAPAGLGIILLDRLVEFPRVDFPWLVWLGFRPADVGMMFDYRPMVPWFGVALLGIAAGYLLYRHGNRRFRLPELGRFLPVRGLALAGRYSLAIYLIHQPVFLAILEVTGVIDLGMF